jgi:type IV secretion system protein TrbJ
MAYYYWWLMPLLLIAWVLFTGGSSQAQIGASLVFDPTNYLPNLMTQLNTLKSTINEATMIANQAQDLEYQATSILNQAKNLKANPLRLLGQIEGLWNAYNTVMGAAEGLTFGLQQAQTNFEQRYPALATPSVQAITQQSAAMLASIRGASKTAVASQSIYERLCAQLDANRQALTSAQASEGALQIAQATAQLQALGNEQIATLGQIAAASGRVQTEWTAMQAKERVDADAAHAQFVGDYGQQGFKGLGQSTPIGLR